MATGLGVCADDEQTYELDRHGNARNVSQAAVEAERVVVVRYVYNDEAGFKGRKKR